MPRQTRNEGAEPKKPARSTQAQERKLVNLAVTLAEKQLADGTASAQVITHYLKLGTATAALERERLEQEVKLKAAQIAAHESSRRTETLYSEAIAAMRRYQGGSSD